jgi:methionine salvage enolase-phosphatase E1
MNNLNKFQQKKNKKMENFVRKNPNELNNVEEIIEKAVQLSKDHSGSRLVQKTYEEGNKDIKDRIFEKFKPEILTLSKDIFGNYAIQKVLESKDGEKDEDKNNFIMGSLKGKIYDLSIHMYGCRVIQQLICVIDEKYLSLITLELKDHFAKLIEDQNGNHVIQKLIERLKIGENNGIYDVVYNNIVYLSKHQYGCRVIQTLLKQCNDEQKKKILDEICKEVKELSEDQYGNYIIQYILEHNKGNNVDIIYEKLKGNIYDFSLHKYASNVIEKALNYGNEKQRKNIIDEIIQKDDQIQESLLSMVKDKFGNYVVQKIIEFSDEKTRENIIKRIISSQSLKKKDGFSKHVINFIEKLNSNNNGNNDKNRTQK